MSRIPALVLVAFASAIVACGSSGPTNGSSGQRLAGDEACKLDPNQCVPTQPELWSTERYRDFLRLRREAPAEHTNAFIREKSGTA